LILKRSDPSLPNMALTSWSGSCVRKQDVIDAKNYLTADEVDTLNRLLVISLEHDELRIKQQKELTLDFWRNNIDRMPTFHDQTILDGARSASRENMEKIARERYEVFDHQRRIAEGKAADAMDLKEIEQLEEDLKHKGKKH